MELSIYERWSNKHKARIVRVCRVKQIKDGKVAYGFAILQSSLQERSFDFDPLMRLGRSWSSKQEALDYLADSNGWRWLSMVESMPRVEVNFDARTARKIKEM